jgi:serine/threonine protein kinase
MTLAPKTTIAMRYKIVSLLGRGGMGHVYRAEHLLLRKPVALKVLDADLVGDLGPRFEREALAMAKLDHPNCIRVLDYGRTLDHLHFIAMDLIEGPTLAALIAQGTPFSVSRTLWIARGLLAALVHAHQLGILHRDVKPENVMFPRQPASSRPVLIDFGLARFLDGGPLTAAGMCVGSPSYLAPERLLGRAYDARADLYSLGVVLYEMLAGARPIAGTTPHDILRGHIDRPPRPLRAIRRDVPLALEACIARTLAKDPARRFPDAEAMLSALSDVPDTVDVPAAAPVLERRDEVITTAIDQVVMPSLPSRIWSWLRYGSWRWKDAQLPAGR